MYIRYISILLFCFFLFSCSSDPILKLSSAQNINLEIISLPDSLKGWQYLDIEIDTIPGISLNRAIKESVLKPIHKRLLLPL